jgi:hypothetical protein
VFRKPGLVAAAFECILHEDSCGHEEAIAAKLIENTCEKCWSSQSACFTFQSASVLTGLEIG